jgi:hypothetical protein
LVSPSNPNREDETILYFAQIKLRKAKLEAKGKINCTRKTRSLTEYSVVFYVAISFSN